MILENRKIQGVSVEVKDLENAGINKDNNDVVSSKTIAMLIHRQYQERIQKALFSSYSLPSPDNHYNDENDGWIHIHNVNDGEQTEAKRRKIETPSKSNGNNNCDVKSWCKIIPTKLEKGTRKQLKGYGLSLFFLVPSSTSSNNTSSFIDVLPAMARQQISWAAEMTHSIKLSSSPASAVQINDDMKYSILSEILYPKLMKKLKDLGFTLSSQHSDSNMKNTQKCPEIRIDIVPKLDSSSLSQSKTNSSSFLPFPKKEEKPNTVFCIRSFCEALQKFARREQKSKKEESVSFNNNEGKAATTSQEQKETPSLDPFDDVFKITRSMSRASIILTIVVLPKEEEGTQHEYMVGISSHSSHWTNLNKKLNDFAASQIRIEPMDPKTGKDQQPSKLQSPTATNMVSLSQYPVSRAYYKLFQVHQDCFSQKKENNGHYGKYGNGIDLGASPGGWTQVLYSYFGFCSSQSKKILSIDPGIVAHRVLNPMEKKSCTDKDSNGSGRGAGAIVEHVPFDFNSKQSIDIITQNAPYSVIVCDASIDFDLVISQIVETFTKAKKLLNMQNNSESSTKEEEGSKSSDPTTLLPPSTQSTNKLSLLTLPCVIIITLKMPYKSPQSLERNLNRVMESLQDKIKKMVPWAHHDGDGGDGDDDATAKVKVQYKILHLFANSSSERTLVIKLDKK